MKIVLLNWLRKILSGGKSSPAHSTLLKKKLYPLEGLEKNISYKFRNKELLLLALIHSSYPNSNHSVELKDNERLEFLGDAILQAAISDFLMARFPNANEGDLSKTRASMVNRYMLAMLAHELGVGNFLIVGRSIDRKRFDASSSILADALEAIIGAIYLDGGFESAKQFIKRIFAEYWEGVKNQQFNRDFKSLVQELSQKKYSTPPKYEMIGEFGVNHGKIFEVQLSIGNKISTRGVGRSKKDAEQQAAKNAFAILTQAKQQQ